MRACLSHRRKLLKNKDEDDFDSGLYRGMVARLKAACEGFVKDNNYRKLGRLLNEEARERDARKIRRQ